MEWSKLVSATSRDDTYGRSEFERDQDRLIFSTAFRRLNDKTQVFPLPEHYFVHNRMTHSIEASVVGRSLGNIVGAEVLCKIDPSWTRDHNRELGLLVQASCLAHDIGNPPFGHAGEAAISSFFERNQNLLTGLSAAQKFDLTNFEGNAQGLRLITQILPQVKLTANTIATFLKYPRESIVTSYTVASDTQRSDQKKYGFFQSEKAILSDIAKEFSLRSLAKNELAFARFPFSYLVEAADDICYLIIDIEDAVRLKVLRLSDVESVLEEIIAATPTKTENGNMASISSIIHTSSETQRMAQLRARAINSLIMQCVGQFNYFKEVIARGEYGACLLDTIPSGGALLQIKKVCEERIYTSASVLEIEAAGFEVLASLLEVLTETVFGQQYGKKDQRNRFVRELFPQFEEFDFANPQERYEGLRTIIDYVSGMTDRFAFSMYRKIKGVGHFEKIQ